MSSGEYVPLSEIGLADENQHLIWGASLPEGMPDDEVGINLRKFNIICELGSLSTVRVKDAAKSETLHPTVAGFSNSTATAAMGGVSHPEKIMKGRSKLALPSQRPNDPFYRDVDIEIDAAGVTERLTREGQVRSPDQWVRHLRKQVNSPFYAAAVSNILRQNLNASAISAFVDGVFQPAFLQAGTVKYIEGTLLTLGMFNAVVQVGFDHIAARAYGFPKDEMPRNYIFIGADRLARIGAQALLNKPLFQAIPA